MGAVGPALALIDALGPHLHAVSPHFLAIAKKSGSSLFRIHRDTRFSKDKAPCKTHIGIQLRHEATKRDVHAPGFYVHLDRGDSGVAAGLRRPEPGVLKSLRDRITTDEGWAATPSRVPIHRIRFPRGTTWWGAKASLDNTDRTGRSVALTHAIGRYSTAPTRPYRCQPA